jgi:hypothetical protein
MTTLREAAQQALEALDEIWSLGFRSTGDRHKNAITALRDALAQEEQEPVAWLKTMYSGTRPMLEVDHLRKDTSTPVYTRPPRREWQSLTADTVFANNEIMAVNASLGLKMNQLMDLVCAIERALKEKNA